MQKKFKLDEVDCANCAAKMETSIGRLNGVESVSINFFTQKMLLEINDDADYDHLIKKVKKAVRRVDPDCEVLE